MNATVSPVVRPNLKMKTHICFTQVGANLGPNQNFFFFLRRFFKDGVHGSSLMQSRLKAFHRTTGKRREEKRGEIWGGKRLKKKLSSYNVRHSFGNLYSLLELPGKRVCWENEGLCHKTCGRICG